MATFKELAEKYSTTLETSTDETAELTKIAKSINGLVYNGDKQPISDDDKEEILTGMDDLFNEKRRVGILKDAENKKYLQLVNQIRALLNG